MALRGPKRFRGFRETDPRTEKEFLSLIFLFKFSSLPLTKSWISQSCLAAHTLYMYIAIRQPE